MFALALVDIYDQLNSLCNMYFLKSSPSPLPIMRNETYATNLQMRVKYFAVSRHSTKISYL